jgi:hypothetical protein
MDWLKMAEADKALTRAQNLMRDGEIMQQLTHRITELDRVLATGIGGKRRQLLIEFRREAYNARNRVSA